MSNIASRKSRFSRLAGLLLVLGSICLALALAELVLQILDFNKPVTYSVWPPDVRLVVTPDQRDTPGISEQPHEFIITSSGYRGRPIGTAELRIAAFGGSTTESLFVPEERTWPRLLEQQLTKALGASVWVGNFGKSGRNTRQHVLDAKYVLPQFSANAALFLIGVNDLAIPLSDPTAQTMSIDEIQSDVYLRKSLIVNDAEAERFKLPGLLRAAGLAMTTPAANPELVHQTTEFYRQQRRLRAERAGFTSQMPELGPFMDEYARNVATIADLVRSSGVVPIFISQPSLWSNSVPPEIDARFWWGAVDGWPPKVKRGFYYSSEALDRMLTAYNDRLRLVARQKNVTLIDAAEKLPKNPAYFYDQVHYNEAGSNALATLITSELAPVLKEAAIR